MTHDAGPPPQGTEISCRELVEVVTAYLDGALAPGERATFEAHLRICDACVVYVRQIEETIRLVGASADELAASPPVQELRELFADWRRGSPEPA